MQQGKDNMEQGDVQDVRNNTFPYKAIRKRLEEVLREAYEAAVEKDFQRQERSGQKLLLETNPRPFRPSDEYRIGCDPYEPGGGESSSYSAKGYIPISRNRKE